MKECIGRGLLLGNLTRVEMKVLATTHRSCNTVDKIIIRVCVCVCVCVNSWLN